jgi:hypothetical protein
VLTLSSFLRNLERLFASDYLPTDQDILHAPSKHLTPGGYETAFELEGSTFRIFHHAGGQVSDQERWLHAVGKVSVILFAVSLGGFDDISVKGFDEVRIWLLVRVAFLIMIRNA